MKDQKKAGIIIQYINIVLNMVISIFFTPFLIKSLGNAEYGLYRIVQSFAGQLSIMTFGIGTIVTRNIVKYDTLNQKKEKENFLAMSGIISGVLAALVLIVGYVLSFGINSIYKNSLSVSEIALAKKLFTFLVINVAVTIMNDYAGGMVSGHERFIVKYGITTLKYLLRFSTLILLLKMGFGALAIVATDLGLSVLILLINTLYGFVKLKERPKLYSFDKKEMIVIFSFSGAILFQAIANQVNQNLDSMILGAMTNSETVTVYSVGLTLFSVFIGITHVLSTVFTPQATKLVFKNSTGEELTDFCIKPGRIQFMLGCLIVSGFLLFGKPFIFNWVGNGFEDAYYVTVILFIPALIPLIQSMTNALLDAMLKRMGRSVILLCMAVFNIVISVILINIVGFIGAAFGTALSYIIGFGILTNIYLKKVTTLNLKKMYKEIVTMPLLITLFAMLAYFVISKFIHFNYSLLHLLIGIVIYIAIWGGLMYFLAMNESEKNLFMKPIRKVVGKIFR